MMELAIRMVVSLAAVLGLLLLCARVGARRFKGRAGSPLQVLHRQSLSRSSGVALVSVGGRMLLLGTTDQQVQMLAEIDPGDLDAAALAPDRDPEADTAPEAPAEAAPGLLGRMALLVEEPTRWIEPRRTRGRSLAAVPGTVDPGTVEPDPDTSNAAAPSVREEDEVASFAAALEAELETEREAVSRLSPAQVLLREEQDHPALAGSLLSPDTWRLAARAVSRRAS